MGVRTKRAAMVGLLALVVAAGTSSAEETGSYRLPDDVQPSIGAWFCSDDFFEPGRYKVYVDLFADHSPFDLLSTSFRVNQREVAEPAFHDVVKEAVAYANERGLDIALDLDVRLARQAFRSRYPSELQEMLRLRTVDLAEAGDAELTIRSEVLTDHMTGNTTPYLPLSSRLVRVYSYVTGDEGIDPDTVKDITAACTVKTASDKEITVAIPCDASSKGRVACVMAAFTHLTPDVYAPHLLGFQRSLVAQYADVELAGIMKDEWGFPPCHGGCPDKNDYWFSEARAKAYAEATGGRDLVRDCLLMHAGEKGRERERQAAINVLLKTSRERNAAIEDQFYRLGKKFFGPDAAIVTHATWVPYPGVSEFKKNGLSWWVATRDWAQTDECAPFPARTSLAKKWGSSVWYNQFYSTHVSDYKKSLWTHALGGGRINYHPIYPNPKKLDRITRNGLLLNAGQVRGECRIRLLTLISDSPVDCPVAVVFGHACAMNWAGPAYDDVGLEVTNVLWRAGFYADLIPSSEIEPGDLRVAEDGALVYGPQKYAAVVLYHPEFENPTTADLFAKVNPARTAMYRVGDWTRDFNARDFDGDAALPRAMAVCKDANNAATRAIEHLRALEVKPYTPATGKIPHGTVCPGRKGHIRLIDGTQVWLAGEKSTAGDPIFGVFDVAGRPMQANAVGVLAVRLSDDGSVDALAAGGLTRFEGAGLSLTFDIPVDIAFWHDADGKPKGALQDWNGAVPESLHALTSNWLRLASPPAYKAGVE